MRTGPHGAGAAAGPGQVRAPSFPGEKGTLPFHPRHGSSAGREGSLAQRTTPELPGPPGARAQDLIQRLPVGPLPLSPGLRRWASWSSLLLLTAFFCQLWPEGTLGSQTMTSALSHPGASQHLPQCGLREKYKPAEALLVADSAANTALWFMRKTHTEMR